MSGGGEVIVPAGKYLIGSVQIGNRTILRLEAGSSIIGSPDAKDYPMMDIRWEGRWQPGRRALIYSANVDHTGIIGPGRIEGNPAWRLRKTRAEWSSSSRSHATTSAGKDSPSPKAAIGPHTRLIALMS